MIGSDKLSRIYTQMKPEELAVIAFGFMVKADEDSSRKVQDAVPMHNYRCKDFEYMRRIDGMFMAASLFGIEVWRKIAGSYMALASSAEALRLGLEKENLDASVKALDAHASCRRGFAAVVRAMETVCAENAIDPASFWSIASANPISADDLGEPDPEIEEQFTTMLRAVITGDWRFAKL